MESNQLESAFPPMELAAWIGGQEGRSIDNDQDCWRHVTDRFEQLVDRYTQHVMGDSIVDDSIRQNLYRRRLWNCLEHHWRLAAKVRPMSFSELTSQLEGDSRPLNLFDDVVLAQALELREARAAELFEIEYMPSVRSIARRAGGDAALDLVENLAADLILPRGDRPPRIAGYQGRTRLAAWLKAVVINLWITQARRKKPTSLAVIYDLPASENVASNDDEDCGRLLPPLLASAVGRLSESDRVLLKMLVLDGAPQHALAAAYGVNSGTLTRRRQRAELAIWQGVQELSVARGQQRRANQCLEFALAGESWELRERLAEILAANVQIAADTYTEVGV